MMKSSCHSARHSRLLGVGLGCLLAYAAHADNWPAWRGPEGIGAANEKSLPLRWSTNENVRWRVPLPERGNSTPIVWGRRVFVTQAVEHRRTLLCLDRTNGKLLWQQGPTYTETESAHETNPLGSSSPVTDGERVIAWFGSAGLYCYDLDGKELWQRDLGPQKHHWGWGSSPMLHGNLCFLNFGPGVPSFLLAVDKHTGKTIWRFKTGSSVNATAITYTHKGRQYVTIASGLGGGLAKRFVRDTVPTGGSVWTFALLPD